jgi:hypothetical protein
VRSNSRASLIQNKLPHGGRGELDPIRAIVRDPGTGRPADTSAHTGTICRSRSSECLHRLVSKNNASTANLFAC